MVLVFVALNAELHPIRARLADRQALSNSDLNAYRGSISGVPVTLVVTGMGMRRSSISAAQAMDSLTPIDFVVSAGVAGGLRDDLLVGQVVLSERLLTSREDDFQPEQTISAPARWVGGFANALGAAGIPYAAGSMMTVRRPIATAADKRRAHVQSGAISVDMESAVIALEAERRGLPFVCMRTILDGAREDVVGARLVDQDGRVRPLTAARALITKPGTIIGAIRLTRNLRLSTYSLASALEAVLPHAQILADRQF